MQYAGRLHRLHAGKNEIQIYDYVDRGVPMLMKMFQRRLRGYRAMGYEVRDPGLQEVAADTIATRTPTLWEGLV